jgi:hypothetical protein
MRQAFWFYCACVRDAWRGCWTRANEKGALLGAGILWIVLRSLSPLLRKYQWIDAPTTYWGGAGFAFASAVASLILAFVAIFIWRLITAPPRLYAALQATIPSIPESDLSVTLHEGMSYEVLADAAGRPLPDSRAWIVRVKNHGNHLLQKCQLMFDEYPASGHFELRRDEYKDFPVLRLQEKVNDPRPIAYFLDPETWKVLDGSGLLVNPGIHKIRVLSADSHLASLDVELSTNAVAPPREWELVPCVSSASQAP